ncbi:hypothetical protein CORT_0A06510 [Candida orthopsilosis Co 90-125]|uniref:Uncharacterized protein n=1 Tax=Candida orthopsilosis (strain 90-125) TaxID=1136231 RepID=H8WWP8_CANO9|nr:hypothetical protein CORT_0A06510 [Candida orthopsilosis Co 90-125]CCG21037.1 hypothetical protein CORT_0A06510 [Candida orthopsilosis Co 90-125]
MEDIENKYSDNTAYQFSRPNNIISTRKGITPLQESSANIINNNNLTSMLRNNKLFTSPIKTANDQLNFKKRAATSPTPTLIPHNTKRKLNKTCSIKADEENISPIKPRYSKSNLDNKSKVTDKSPQVEQSPQTEQEQSTNDNIGYPLWPPQSIAEAQLHRQLYQMEQSANHYQQLSNFLVLERKFQIEAGEFS